MIVLKGILKWTVTLQPVAVWIGYLNQAYNKSIGVNLMPVINFLGWPDIHMFHALVILSSCSSNHNKFTQSLSYLHAPR